jgi:hypothetical protein
MSGETLKHALHIRSRHGRKVNKCHGYYTSKEVSKRQCVSIHAIHILDCQCVVTCIHVGKYLVGLYRSRSRAECAKL